MLLACEGIAGFSLDGQGGDKDRSIFSKGIHAGCGIQSGGRLFVSLNYVVPEKEHTLGPARCVTDQVLEAWLPGIFALFL